MAGVSFPFWITKLLGRTDTEWSWPSFLAVVGTGYGGHSLWWALALEAAQLRQGGVGRWGRGRFDNSLQGTWCFWVALAIGVGSTDAKAVGLWHALSPGLHTGCGLGNRNKLQPWLS